MGFIGMLITGFIVGLIARAVKPGNDNMGIILTTILGIIGAVLAGYAGRALGWYAADEPAGLIASVIGAVVVLFIASAVMSGRTRRI